MSLFNKLQNRFRKNTVKDLQNEKPQEETEVFFLKKNLNLKYLNSLSFSFSFEQKREWKGSNHLYPHNLKQNIE